MKTTRKLIVAFSLVTGFAVSNSIFAANSSSALVNESNQKVQQYQDMVSTDTMLKYGNILLNRSTVANKLKFSTNPIDNDRYRHALDTYKSAERQYQIGNDDQAKRLALNAIREIARAVPQYYTQTAKAE